MSSQTPNVQETLNQVATTAEALAPVALQVAAASGAVNPAAAAAAGAAIQALPQAVALMNQFYALSQAGHMTKAQFLQAWDSMSTGLAAAQKALDECDPKYAASVPSATIAPAASGVA